MFLFAGLGNKGKEYKNNRHNIGFIALDILAETLNLNVHETSGFLSLTFQFDLKGSKIMCAKPQTFMNLSGEAIQKIASFYKIPLENIFVFHDDIDISLGEIRFKTGGGAGGHNGLKSIDSHIGKDYSRIRIGVGRPEAKEEVADYVLSNLKKNELEDITFKLAPLFKNLPLLLEKKFSDLSQILL